LLNPPYSNRRTHYLALAFAAMLIILTGLAFASFAIGAQQFFSGRLSNVVAETEETGGQYYLQINATGLASNASRIVWVDPRIQYNASGEATVNPSAGFRIADIKTNSQGGLSSSFQLSPSVLQQISSDGEKVHSVWILGINQTMQSSNGYELITSDSERNYSAATTGAGITFFVTLFTLVLPVNYNLGELFLALWTIYLILFAIALNGPFLSILRSIRSVFARGVSGLFQNSMLATMLVFPVVFFASVVLALIQQAGGIATGSLPPTDPVISLVELSLAPLREEIGFRVIPIGIVIFFILVARLRIRDGLLGIWHPSRYLKRNDTPEQYKRDLNLVYVLIGISAFLFGVAHYALGAGWGPGKITEAAVAGLALGGLYYKYGFPATVLLHWLIDYFLQVFTLTPSLTTIGDVIVLYTIPVAVCSSIVLLLLFVGRFRKRSREVYQENWVPAHA
jgi:hypothetical protein